jgi:hypothetical protein
MRCHLSYRSRSGFGPSTPMQRSATGGFLEIPHASARTGIFADGGRVFVSETVAAKPQPPLMPLSYLDGSKAAMPARLSTCLFGAVHLMHHTQASGYVER